MATMLYPNAGALAIAEAIQTLLAGSDLHLFQSGSVSLTPSTTLAELDAVEADFTGYAVITIAAWLDPLLNPLGGASIECGTQQFAIAAPYTVSNVIQGWYLTETGGDLICAGDFPQPVALVGAGDGIPVNVQLVFG
jgi:hypothetical protein